MMVRFDVEARSVKQRFAEYLQLARSHLVAKSDALAALWDGAEAKKCHSPEMLQGIGLRLAEAERAEKQHMAGLMKAWSLTAQSLSNLADILVDGGLLLHQLKLGAFAPDLNDGSETEQGVFLGLENGTNPVSSASEAVSLLEESLQKALSGHVGAFSEQVSRAFDISESLSAMWAGAMVEPPQGELEELRSSWGKVRMAALELRDGLKDQGRLRRELLLSRLEDAAKTPLEMHFAVPEECAKEAPRGAALWRRETSDGTAVLLSTEGDALQCDLKSGHVWASSEGGLSLQAGDLGAGLSILLQEPAETTD